MHDEFKPLFVRLARHDADRLEAAVAETGKSKRQLVTDAVRCHLEDSPLTLEDGQLTVGRINLREQFPEVMTLAEAAAFLRVDEAVLKGSAERGDVPGRLIGDEWRFSQAVIVAWLGGQR